MSDGYTPLERAVKYCRVKIIKILLCDGRAVLTKKCEQLINANPTHRAEVARIINEHEEDEEDFHINYKHLLKGFIPEKWKNFRFEDVQKQAEKVIPQSDVQKQAKGKTVIPQSDVLSVRFPMEVIVMHEFKKHTDDDLAVQIGDVITVWWEEGNWLWCEKKG